MDDFIIYVIILSNVTNNITNSNEFSFCFGEELVTHIVLFVGHLTEFLVFP